MIDHKTGGFQVRSASSLFLHTATLVHISQNLVMLLQERKTRTFFFILERSYSSVDAQPPLYVASAPEFSTAPKFLSIIGTGSSEREALNRLKHHIKVTCIVCYMLAHKIVLKHAVHREPCAAEATLSPRCRGAFCTVRLFATLLGS